MTEPTDAELGKLAEECGIGWGAGLGGMSDQEARQASAFRPGKESAKPVRASLGATDQSAAVAQEHQPCELFPIARA